jgi:hypothetical protein
VFYQPHIRFFPVDDNAGTVSFGYEFFLLRVDGTTSLKSSCIMSGTVEAGDKTLNKGRYISTWFETADFVGGDQIVGVLMRLAGTYPSDVAMCEYGIHAPIKSVGFVLEQVV